jgi:tRNA G18 (ribose-2'-O)-methylase SpoU
MKLDAKKLRQTIPSRKDTLKIKKNDIYIILDNVLDTYNVGAIFRLADAVAARKIFICGHTETPPNTRIKKSSINTTEWVEWEYYRKPADAIYKLKRKNPKLKTISIEQSPGSISYTKADYSFPIALVVGNETHGISKDVLEISDQIVELPMFGVNVSLNTMVSLAITLYKTLENNKLI